jgi:hypothetical protein
MPLQHFPAREIVLTQEEAFHVFRFFWPDCNLHPGQLTETDREFAQALLIEAIDASERMSWIEALFRAAARPNADVRSILKKMAAHALKKWFTNLAPRDILNQDIYEAVRATLARNFRSIVRLREQGVDSFSW